MADGTVPREREVLENFRHENNWEGNFTGNLTRVQGSHLE